jgi:2-isopropylmalate synthase
MMVSMQEDGQHVLIADTSLRDEHLVAADPRLVATSTLRDIWRSNPLSVETRRKLALQLSALHVDVLEAGIGDTTTGLDAMHEIARELRGDGPIVSGLARALGDDTMLDAAGRALAIADRFRIHLYTATSDLLDEQGYFRSQPLQLLDSARRNVAQARTYTADVEFSPPQVGPEHIELIAEWTAAAVDEGAGTINIRTFSTATAPNEYRETLQDLKSRAPRDDVVWSGDVFIPHLRGAEALSVAVRCAEEAIEAGCRQIKCAMHGIAGTPGHAPLELIAFGIWFRNHIQTSQLWTSIDMHKLIDTSDIVADAKGADIPPTQPLVGSDVIEPKRDQFPDEPKERAAAAQAHSLVLACLGQPAPQWLHDWASDPDIDT